VNFLHLILILAVLAVSWLFTSRIVGFFLVRKVVRNILNIVTDVFDYEDLGAEKLPSSLACLSRRSRSWRGLWTLVAELLFNIDLDFITVLWIDKKKYSFTKLITYRTSAWPANHAAASWRILLGDKLVAALDGLRGLDDPCPLGWSLRLSNIDKTLATNPCKF